MRHTVSDGPLQILQIVLRPVEREIYGSGQHPWTKTTRETGKDDTVGLKNTGKTNEDVIVVWTHRYRRPSLTRDCHALATKTAPALPYRLACRPEAQIPIRSSHWLQQE